MVPVGVGSRESWSHMSHGAIASAQLFNSTFSWSRRSSTHVLLALV